MIYTTAILLEQLTQYSNPMAKISNMMKKKEIIPIVKGLYETDPKTPGHYLASIIYGPSYLSFEFALSYYSLIPEAVYHFTSATFNKRRRKIYDNEFGHYTYRDVPKKVFGLATILYQQNGYSYVLAKAEKAICDILYTYEPCSNQSELKSLLFDFLRIDYNQFFELDLELIFELAPYYKTRNLQLLVNYLKREIKNRNNS